MAITDIEGNPIDQSSGVYDSSVGAYVAGNLVPISPTSPDESSDGTTLEHLGTFFGTLGTSVSSVIRAVNTTQPVTVHPTIPNSSASILGGSSSSSIITALLIAVLLFFGYRAFARK